MTPERWSLVGRIFEQALEFVGDQRVAFLKVACGTDKALFEEVDSLLKEESGHGLLDTSSIPSPHLNSARCTTTLDCSTTQRRTSHPQNIGPYKIERELGRGGMGIVFLATRSDQFQKTVAVKVLRGSDDNLQMIKRFQFERQALASMEHPHIARLLDGGTTEDGEPFFAMEYVRDGISIDRYCQKHQLGLRQVIEHFLMVCSAVEYAHRCLIVHRDLKPSNILVDTEGQVKLVDFGIAKALQPLTPLNNDAPATHSGMLAMTPEYASPEQIRGEMIGVASDVYALGVVLYQLLTGALPFPKKTMPLSELMRRICEEEPRRPSTMVGCPNQSETASEPSSLMRSVGKNRLIRTLRGDLDNIVLMAIRKEPSQRYGSVEQLREDLIRFLNGSPITARPATLLYRTSKFLKRHPVETAFAALLVASLVGGLFATSQMAQRAEQQRAIAQAQALEAERQRQLAQRNAIHANSQAAEATKQRISADRRFEELRRLASSMIFELDAEVIRLAGSTSVRKLIVDKGQQYLELLARERAGDQKLGEELAYAYTVIGLIQRARNRPNLGDANGSRRSYRKALEIAEQVRSRHGDSAQLVRTRAYAHGGLGDLESLDGNSERARMHYQTGLRLAEQLASWSPDRYHPSRNLLPFFGKLSEIAQSTGRLEEAEQYLVRARDWSINALKTRSRDRTAMRDRVISDIQLAHYLRRAARWQESLRIHESSIAVIEALLADPQTAPRARRDAMVNYAGMGQCWTQLGSYEKALEYHSKELSLCMEQLREDPKSILSHYDLSGAESHVAFDLLELGRHTQAMQHARAAIKAAESAAAIDARSIMTLRHLYGSQSTTASVWMAQGQWQEASKNVAFIVTLVEDALRRQSSDQAIRLGAEAYSHVGDLHRRAMLIDHSEDHAHLGKKYYSLAMELYKTINDTQELAWLQRKLDAITTR